VQDIKTEKELCDKVAVLGGEPSEACQSVETRQAEAQEVLNADTACQST